MKGLLFFCLCVYYCNSTNAQVGSAIAEMEAAHKACLSAKPDSTGCSRVFMIQMDSMVQLVFNEAKESVFSDEKASLIKEQLSWNSKKETFFKKQDENFTFQIKEGTWKKDMVRFVYEEKAEFVLKRIKVLLKRLGQ